MDTQAESSWLLDSWGRSKQAGLSQKKQPDDFIMSSALLNERCQQNDYLIEAVEQQAVPLFNQIFARSDSRLLLTDADAVVIASWGQGEFREKLTGIALSSGACWQEKYKGTNAIGTALVEQRPISVIGNQHFIQKHRFVSCTASPIFDHSGHLVGILDITSEQRCHNSSTQILVQTMVQKIENQLLAQIPNGHTKVHIACDRQLLETEWQGILIANESGQILAQNQFAGQLLSQPNVIGKQLNEVLDCQQQRNDFVFTKHALTSTQNRGVISPSAHHLHFGDNHVELCWQQSNRVIDKDISLLIMGETGVGKNEFVKALHRHSLRRNQPLVSVNCGALPKDLIESELFGYVAGAFTGASSKGFQGKIRQASGGILFLDEIADLPLDAQSRLLHVLQDKVVAPIGTNESFQVDVQVVSATHKDVEALIQQGLFRQDLYYRLNGLAIELPRLQDRTDKAALIESIYRRYAFHEQRLDDDLFEALMTYHWPGNLRELDSLLKVAALLSEDSDTLRFEHIPQHLSIQLSRTIKGGNEKQVDGNMNSTDLKSTIEETLVKTYFANNGNVSRTSKVLGVSRNTIYRKLKSLGILT